MRDLYSYSLSPDQFAGAQRRVSARFGERMHTRWLVEGASALSLVAALAITAHPLTDGRLLGSIGMSVGAAMAVAVVCALLALFARHHGIQLLVRRSTFAPGRWQVGVDDEGLWTQGPHGEAFTRWSGWRWVEERGGLVLVYHDDVHAHPIPFAAFHSPEERSEFVEHVRARIAAQPGEMRAQPAPHPPVATPTAQPEGMPVVFAPTFRTLVDSAVKIALLRRVAPSQLAVTWAQVVGLVLATLLPPLAFALATLGEAGHLGWSHLPEILFHVPVILVSTIMLACLIGRTVYVEALLAGALLAWVVIDSVSLGLWLAVARSLGEAPAASMAFHYVPIAWLAIAVGRLAMSFVPAPAPRRGWVLATCVFFLALPLAGVHRERSLWSAADEHPVEQARSGLPGATVGSPLALLRGVAD